MVPIRPGAFARLLAFTVMSIGAANAGVISVTPVVTPNGPLFHYNYSITNGTGIDVAVLDIMVKPGVLTIQNLVAPTGYQTAYDSGLGLVSFLEDTASFGATAISGFAFDSPLSARGTSYNATFFDGTTSSGSTQGPVVPEPGTAMLAIVGATGLIVRRFLKI